MLAVLVIASCWMGSPAAAAEQNSKAAPHALFVWAGDQAKQGNDFLLVIDADPQSPRYGRFLSAVESDQRTLRPHHTEYTMPASGMLFANDHDAGRTFIVNVRDPLHPVITTSFGDMAGFSHPHSFLRLPNGHVLASFQHDHHATHQGTMGVSGGLVEIDDHGKVVRAVSNADAAFPDALLMPYSLVVLPGIDRVVSTNSSMQMEDVDGTTYQVWRLSDLKLLKTAFFDVGEYRYSHLNPEEPRAGADGAVYVQTLSCGVERITGIGSAQPTAKLVYTFPGRDCGVPSIIGHYLVQSVPAIHGFIVLDIADGARPVEVSRLTVSAGFAPHWTAWDPKTDRLVVTPGSPKDNRMYLLKFDVGSGALTMDDGFRDVDGKVGISFDWRTWPQGWTGSGLPHGAVFSR
ncbi:MAG: hypothetical protein ABIQ36_13975 [Rhodanobacter sp.]